MLRKRVKLTKITFRSNGSINFLKQCMEVWVRQQVPVRSAALTYTSFLAVVPSLAIIIGAIAWVARLGQVPDSIHNFLIDTLPEDAALLLVQYSDFSNISSSLESILLQTFSSSVGNVVVEQLQNFLRNIRFDSIGYVGFASLTVTSILLLLSIERTMNRIWCVPKEKSWSERLLLYFCALSFSPILLSLIFTSTSLITPIFPELVPAAKITSAFVTFIFLLLIYSFFPNTKVKVRSAAFGALFSTIGIEALKIGFGLYTRQAILYNTLYGSLAALPFFLVWLYSVWTIFLMGTIICFVLETSAFKKKLGSIGQWDPETVFDKEKARLILEIVIILKEKSLTYSELKNKFDLPEFAILNALEWMRRQKWLTQRRSILKPKFFLRDNIIKSTDSELWQKILGISPKEIRNDKVWEEFLFRDKVKSCQ